MKNKNIIRIAVVTGLILLIPLVAMQFTEEVNWSLGDFVVMGALLFGTGLILDFTLRKVHKTSHRIGIAFVILAAFLYVWAELAVGIFTNWGS